MNKAVFLDRDGVINVDKHFVHKIENFELKRGIVELLQYLTTQNYKLFVVTNQSGIGRGYFTETDFLRLTEYMITIFKEYGVSFEEVYHCSCAPEKDCECRKPSPHMINKGVDKYEIDVSMSWLIGDKESDIGAANNAGIYNTIKVLGKEKPGSEKYTVKELHEIKELIK